MFRLRRQVYCDNNATTAVIRGVRGRMNAVLRDAYGNPSSLYRVARNAALILDESRRMIARTIGALPEEIIFTGSATEANNTVLKTLFERHWPMKRKIIASPIEHASIMSSLDYLRNHGAIVDFLPVDKLGRVNPADLKSRLDESTFLVCCMLANNETGVVQDIKKLSSLARQAGALMMSDCVQALGKIPVNVVDLGLDYAAFSAHKIHGPKGVGALYARRGAPISPFIHGGHQESGLRAGTEGIHNIAGFAAACREVPQNLAKAAATAKRTQNFAERLRAVRGDIRLNSPRDGCLPNTVSVTFPGVGNAVLMAMLDSYGIAVSAGSACNTGEDAPSHVLKALGLSDEEARRTIRFSFSHQTGDNDIAYVIKVLDDYFTGRTPPVNAVSPAQLDENILMDERTFILDARHWYDRKLLRSLPNSYEVSPFAVSRHLKNIPRDRHILIVCQAGYDAPVVAYYLRSKHYRNVSFLMTGLLGWKLVKPDLYGRLAGKNVRKLGEEP